MSNQPSTSTVKTNKRNWSYVEHQDILSVSEEINDNKKITQFELPKKTLKINPSLESDSRLLEGLDDSVIMSGMLSLPTEVLLIISGYLSMDDLFSWSRTCLRLQSVLNDDSVWKRFVHYVELTPLQLQELLSPLCSNRLHLLRKVMILNNWTRGICSFHVIQGYYGSTIEGKRSLSSEMSMYDDSFVFLVTKYHNFSAVELWDIRENPFLLTHVEYKSVNRLHVVGDSLVIFDNCRIYIHEICIEENALPFKYVLQTSEEDIALSSLANLCCHKTNQLKLCYAWNHNVYKQFLISCNKNKLLIWDIEKSIKVITYNFPDVSRMHVEGDFSYGSHVLVKTFPLHGAHELNTFKVLNVFENQSFDLEQLKIVPDHIVLQDSHFVAFRYNSSNSGNGGLFCSVNNLKTCKLLNQRLFTDVKTTNGVKSIIVNGRFALPCTGSTLKVVDATTLNVIHTIECNQDVEFIMVYQFNILSTLFVGTRDSYYLKIWNTETKEKLPFQIDDLVLSFNKDCSKVVFYNCNIGTITVLNFLV